VPGESKLAGAASLFNETPLPQYEQMVLDRLRHDESVQLDDLIEQLEAELGSAEIFTALFELEIAGRVRQLPGKNYVRSF
jgi:DNA processing protein